MLTESVDIPTTASLAQQVVFTLSRIGISPREVREIVDYIRIINSKGLSESEIPDDKHFIFREMAKDGIIKKFIHQDEIHYKAL